MSIEPKRTPAQLAQLKHWYVIESLSAAQTAAAFNKAYPSDDPMTRNAVTGIAAGGEWFAQRRTVEKPTTSNVPAAPRVGGPERGSRRPHAVPAGARPLYRCEGGLDVGIGPKDCKFPVGASPSYDMASQLFCGQPRAAGSPYCEAHGKDAFYRRVE